MKLCEQGRLSLGDRVFGADGILNDSLFRNIRDKRIEKITVEHLLRHQGGYSIRSGDPLFCSVSVAKQLGIAPPVGFDDMVRYAAETRLRYEPGSSNLYSNLGYVVLTKVIEKASGLPYESFIRDSILSPAGCHDMHIGRSSYEQKFPNEVRYYEPSDAEPTEAFDGSGRLVPRSYGGCDMQVLSGAGGWVASPAELMKFITAIDPGDSRPDILKPETIAYMTEKRQIEIPDRLDENHRKRRLVAHRVAVRIERNAQTAARRLHLGIHHQHEFLVGFPLSPENRRNDETSDGQK